MASSNMKKRRYDMREWNVFTEKTPREMFMKEYTSAFKLKDDIWVTRNLVHPCWPHMSKWIPYYDETEIDEFPDVHFEPTTGGRSILDAHPTGDPVQLPGVPIFPHKMVMDFYRYAWGPDAESIIGKFTDFGGKFI